jgi:hypothetical protein
MDGDGWSELILAATVFWLCLNDGMAEHQLPGPNSRLPEKQLYNKRCLALYFAASRSAHSSMEKLAIISCGPLLAGFDSQAKAWPGLHLTLGSASAAGPIAVDIDADGDIDLFSWHRTDFCMAGICRSTLMTGTTGRSTEVTASGHSAALSLPNRLLFQPG